MSDTRRRAVERLALQGDPGAAAAVIAERLRAGDRDPRLDPVIGDRVGARPGKRPMHYTDTGTWSGPRREVEDLWPKVLAESLVARPFWAGVVIVDGGEELPVNARVLACDVYERSREGVPFTWRLTADPRIGPLVEWVEFVAYREPSLRPIPRVLAEPEAVEWRHYGACFGSRKPQRSTLAAWRRWAKGGTVLHLGDA